MTFAADPTLTAEVADLLSREAYLLDARKWQDWLALYADDAVYWAPAWASDDSFTADPDRELSLMYMDKAGLEARVFRIEGEESWATDPLPWTAHLVTNVLVLSAEAEEIEATAAWLVHAFARSRGGSVRGGRYAYRLRRTPAGLRIARKTIYVYDDRIFGALDVYNV
jgi:3-phenylpropionate/cinnamic acid dioxygenase small subunit